MRRLLLPALLLLSGCRSAPPTPMTALEMSKVGTGEALVEYLSQPDTTAAVCDRDAKGPAFRGEKPEDFAALVDALGDSAIPPGRWQRCVMLMLGSMKPAQAANLLDAMAHGYKAFLSTSSIESDGNKQKALEALHQAFRLRPRGTAPHPEVVADDVSALRTAVAEGVLGPVASRFASEVLTAIEFGQGRCQGAPLTLSTLDGFQAKKDEDLLRLVALRVPDTKLEKEAKRRIVRLHIEASPSAYTRQHADEVEVLVTETGRNAVDLAKHPATGAWVDSERAPIRPILIRQDILGQTATLLTDDGKKGPTLIPSLDLRGALFVRATGVDEPITVCAPPEALDVTPCVLPSELHPTVPVVFIDAEGLLHFVERIASADALRLVYNTPNLPLPIEIHGAPLLALEWPVVFERPESLVFSGGSAGPGPDLSVVLERRYSPRILFEVAAPQGKLVGVVEAGDLTSFVIASRGGDGTPGYRGSDGANGMAGSNGMSASCPSSPGTSGGNGTAGGNGTSGGPGGPGGPGGHVKVDVTCASRECSAVATLAQTLVRSLGGAGGPGGEGGRGGTGGPGGMGGSGTSCTDSQGHSTYLSGGSPGMQGPNGSPGARGANGPDGAPGRVEIRGGR